MKKIEIEQQRKINGGGEYDCPEEGPYGEQCDYTTDWYVLYWAHTHTTHVW